MNTQQLQSLSLRETDVEGAIYRCCGSEQLYLTCLKSFLNDKTMEEMTKAIEKQSWNDAFTAAHALKGLAGNLGFVPLMHATGRLVVVIRGGRMNDVRDSMEEVKSCYRDIIDAIIQCLSYQVI